MRNILPFILMFLSTSILAQEVDLKTELDKPKRTLDLTFRIDRTFGALGDVNMDYSYQGEFEEAAEPFDPSNLPPGVPPDWYYYYAGYYGNINLDPEWRWIDTTLSKNDWTQFYKVRDIKVDFLLSMTEHLNVGFSYNFTYLKESVDFGVNVEKPYFMGRSNRFILFTTLGPVVEYEFEMPFAEGLQITPSIFLGSYQSSSGLEGVGREFYIDGRVAAEYVLWERLGIRAFAAYNKWGYRENERSAIFTDRKREVEIDWNMFQAGIGLSYRFKLRPE